MHEGVADTMTTSVSHCERFWKIVLGLGSESNINCVWVSFILAAIPLSSPRSSANKHARWNLGRCTDLSQSYESGVLTQMPWMLNTVRDVPEAAGDFGDDDIPKICVMSHSTCIDYMNFDAFGDTHRVDVGMWWVYMHIKILRQEWNGVCYLPGIAVQKATYHGHDKCEGELRHTPVNKPFALWLS